MFTATRRYQIAGFALASAMLFARPSEAGLALTPDGVADGFTVSTFVSGYNPGGPSLIYGPLAQGILPNGDVITGSSLNKNVYIFSDTDGQTLATALSVTPYTCQTSNCNFAMATAGGQVYGSQSFGGIYEHFATDGTFTPIPNLQAANLFGNLGMAGNPVNGHLIAASNQGLVDIDPVAGTYRVIVPGISPDGVTVSPDGTTAYVQINGGIQAYNIATGLPGAFYSGNGHGPDGTGVIVGGKFNGDLVVNDNDGTVGLIDTLLGTEDIIASGGTRGDYVSPDINNGTLFLSQNEAVDRLSCGPGCTIGGTPVPEPSSLVLLAGALMGLGLLSWRRTKA